MELPNGLCHKKIGRMEGISAAAMRQHQSEQRRQLEIVVSIAYFTCVSPYILNTYALLSLWRERARLVHKQTASNVARQETHIVAQTGHSTSRARTDPIYCMRYYCMFCCAIVIANQNDLNK